jgi:CHAD domain-containing protein
LIISCSAILGDRATGDAEALHQCRVAIRRLRVAWGLFAKLVGG